MSLQQKVRRTVGFSAVDSFGVICKINHSIFNSLKICRYAIMFIEHPIFPASSWWTWKGARAFVGLKLVAVVGVLHKELHMLADVNLDYDWRIVLYVKLQVLQVLCRVTHFVHSLLQWWPNAFMLFSWLLVHVQHSLYLKWCHSGMFGL